MQGRTGAKYITHTGLPFSLQPGSQISQHQLFGLHAPLLHRLHVAALLRHAQLAVPARGNAPLTQGILVDVTHLAAGQTNQTAFDQARRQLTGRSRADGVHPGLDLHPRRNAQHRLPVPDHGTYITRSAIATGK